MGPWSYWKIDPTEKFTKKDCSCPSFALGPSHSIVTSHEQCGISDHWQLDCLFHSLFWLTPKKQRSSTSLASCKGNTSPHKGPVMGKGHDIIMNYPFVRNIPRTPPATGKTKMQPFTLSHLWQPRVRLRNMVPRRPASSSMCSSSSRITSYQNYSQLTVSRVRMEKNSYVMYCNLQWYFPDYWPLWQKSHWLGVWHLEG